MKYKIFYIGFQRVGTKSFGMFMELNGFQVASWGESCHNKWNEMFYDGNINKILRSKPFENYEVFEDSPWYQPALVKYIYHEIPNSKFILLTRPAEDWFKSMTTHSAGLNLGDIKNHCENYDRLDDYYWILNNLNEKNEFKISLYDKPYHYMNVYRKKTLDIKLFFEEKKDKNQRVFLGNLYEKNIYEKIAEFLNIDNPIFLKKKKHKSKINPKKVILNLNKVHNDLLIYDKNIKRDTKEKILRDIKDLNEYLKESPENHNMLRRIGEKFIELKKINDAEKYIRMGIKHYDKCPKLYYLLAKINLMKRHIRESELAIKKSLDLAPDHFLYTKLYKNLQHVQKNE